jgi:hypothetical protein
MRRGKLVFEDCRSRGGEVKSNRLILALALAVWTLAVSAPVRADYPYEHDHGGYDRYPPPPRDYPRRVDPGYCDYYARDHADRYARPGAGAVGGAVRGAAKGAIFGAIVGGSKGAKRGAKAGAGLGVIANGARNQRERDYAYMRAYDDCMSDFRR